MSKVAVIRCESYDTEQVYDSVKKGLSYFGGISHFVSSDEKILLKPNLLRGKQPEYAVTTHPAVFEAVVRLLKEANCEKLVYGDSPGVGHPEKAAKESGIFDVAQKYGIPSGDFTTGQTVDFPEGEVTKSFEIAKAVIETDAIISLCKMKTHGLTRITGAVKNQLGCVYGFNKGVCHARFPESLQFSRMLVDLNRLLKPRLFIMDGIVAMEGNGPASGTPVAMNCLIISDDPVAVDATFAKMVDLNPDFVPPVTAGEEMGLGSYTDIEYCGDSWTDFLNKDFIVERLPVKNENAVSVGLRSIKYVKNWITRKPVITAERCIGCGICIKACPLPEKALSWKESGSKRIPCYDYKKCIRCYCCQEMCPQKAIEVKTPVLGKLFIYR